MARLIDADRLIDGLKIEFGTFAMKFILAFIKAQPTVDPVKHGHWIPDSKLKEVEYFRCSNCNRLIQLWWGWRVSFESPAEEYRYCSGCGAKMDEKEDSNHDD